MTEPAPRARVHRPGPFPVIAGTLGVFLVVLTLLAFQSRAARDTAIGASPQPLAAVAPAPRRVLIRRVIVTRVVTRVRRDPPAAVAAPAPRYVAATPAPAVRSAAPAASVPHYAAPAAPAPRPAAPAPAPAPLTTRSS